jgi:hypothetical protein
MQLSRVWYSYTAHTTHTHTRENISYSTHILIALHHLIGFWSNLSWHVSSLAKWQGSPGAAMLCESQLFSWLICMSMYVLYACMLVGMLPPNREFICTIECVYMFMCALVHVHNWYTLGPECNLLWRRAGSRSMCLYADTSIITTQAPLKSPFDPAIRVDTCKSTS